VRSDALENLRWTMRLLDADSSLLLTWEDLETLEIVHPLVHADWIRRQDAVAVDLVGRPLEGDGTGFFVPRYSPSPLFVERIYVATLRSLDEYPERDLFRDWVSRGLWLRRRCHPWFMLEPPLLKLTTKRRATWLRQLSYEDLRHVASRPAKRILDTYSGGPVELLAARDGSCLDEWRLQ